MRPALLCLALILLCGISLRAQDPNASVSGRVQDPSSGVVPGTHVTVINDATNVVYSGITNEAGVYSIPSVPPGKYHIQVSKNGFKNMIKPDVILHVQDAPTINFTLEVGAASESVTVEGGAPLVDTESGSVGTVIDQKFVSNLPMNGRSFNTLLQLTPGVVITPNANPGQFSISGQRTDSNYFQVDGVSANFGISTSPQFLLQNGNGGVQAFNAFGGTSSLVSVDAMQEFRVETSSFAPEYGRTPGGQVLITTRSGTNQFHGTAFDYFRNTVLDANDWFANNAGLSRAAEHQNDFGGVFGGPIWRDKTFFFFSYEGLRLLQPQTTLITVPSAAIRTDPNTSSAAVPILDAYPLPNGAISPGGSTADFTGNYSNRITMNAVGLRLDHSFKDGLTVFGRFNWAPSESINRVNSLSDVQRDNIKTLTGTAGFNQQISAGIANSLRFNYSKQTANETHSLDSFGGAVPLDNTLLLPNAFSLARNFAVVDILDTKPLEVGRTAGNAESQLNILDDFSIVKGAHQIKFGADYRQLTLSEIGAQISPVYISFSTSSFATSGSFFLASIDGFHPGQVRLRNTSIYAQDRVNIRRRLTITYGLRWEINPAPSPQDGTTLAAWQNVNDPQSISLAAPGAPIYSTTYGNVAPRVGVAYRLDDKGNFVIRGGWGIFYDLGTSIAPQLLSDFPNAANSAVFGVQLPVPNFSSLMPTFSTQPPYGAVTAFDPALKLPYSYQWNVALERLFWEHQAISVTYVGQVGRRQSITELNAQPTTNFPSGYDLVTGVGSSDYHALQVQYKRPLYRGIQALLNYTWSHSIDTASNDIDEQVSSLPSPASLERGSSNFDVRHNFTGTLTYDLPRVKKNGFLAGLTENWSFGSVWQVRSGFPINVFTESVSAFGTIPVQPNLTGAPIWIPDPTVGPGKRLNPNAFAVPTTAAEGNLGRNSIYGLGASQIDLTLERAFVIAEGIRLSFRTDAFNVLNHPNFANPDGNIDNADFGQFTQMLNRGLGGLNQLYQIGGPRSLQLSLRLTF
jgi:hypothetical protein